MADDLDRFIEEHSRVVELNDGTEVFVRPIVPADRVLILEGFAHLSEESRWRRFLRPVSHLSDRELSYLTELDYVDHFAWGAQTTDDPPVGLGVGRYVRDREDPTIAEAAVVVVDDWQGRGIGTMLLELLALSAAQNGVKLFRAFVASSNKPAKDLLSGLGAEGRYADGMWVSEMSVPASASPLAGTPLHRALVAAATGDVEFEPPPGT